jgi:hypothetical protein
VSGPRCELNLRTGATWAYGAGQARTEARERSRCDAGNRSRQSGDRSNKHSHYLKGSIYCACDKRLGYGRHRGRHGGVYDYFGCLSRVQRGGRCSAPNFRVEPVERALEARYKTLTLTAVQQEAIREALHDYVDARAEVARRESSRHTRRLRELTGEQEKLVQPTTRARSPREVLEAEQPASRPSAPRPAAGQRQPSARSQT